MQVQLPARLRFRTSYDRLGRLTILERLNADGSVYSTETRAYNWQDLLVSVTSPTTNVTSRAYDILGRLTKETYPDGKFTTIAYTDIALYQKVTDPGGNARAFYRDFAGRLIKVQELGPVTTTTTYAYDRSGNLLAVTSPLGQVNTHEYDDLNRLTRTVYADGASESYTYFDSGVVKSKTARNGSLTQFGYDDAYRMTSVDYPGTASDATHGYDANGNPTSVANGVSTLTYAYDLKDRATSERVVFSGSGAPDVTTGFTFTKAGDLSALSYPGAAFSLSYEYDDFHRAKRAYQGSTNYAQFTYLKDDAIQDLTFANGLKTFLAYDKRSRPTSITTKDGSTVTWSFGYAYDNDGNVLSMVGTGIPTQTFGYDARDRLTQSTGTAWGDLTYAYDALGNRERIDTSVVIRPNGAGTPNQWARVGCTSNYQCVDEGPSHDSDSTYVSEDVHLESDQYAFQDVSGTGSIASVTVSAVARDIPLDPCTPPGSCPFYLQLLVNGYASPMKLLSSTYQTYSHTWTSNPAGGAWTVTAVNALQAGVRKYELNALADSETRVTQVYVTVTFTNATTYTYDNGPTGMNRLLSIGGSGAATFTYTTNGDVETRTEGGVTWTYAYNEMGLLREVKEGSTVRAQYFYDGLGRRVKTVEGGTTTYVVYGLGMDPIFERSVSGSTTDTRYVFANGMRIAKLVGNAAPFTAYYYHVDSLGSTWRITDAAKAVALSTSYEPFGRSWGSTGNLAASERYRFLGERNDTESGLTYLRARQYDSRTGRFTSMDPVLGASGEPQTLNRYPYVVNNPGRYIDPTGEFLWILGILAWGFAMSGMLCYSKTGDLDCAMMAIGSIPIFGDLIASTYFVLRDLNACLNWWEDEDDAECNPGMIGLDALGFLPFVPSLGVATHVGRGANRADPLVDALRRGGGGVPTKGRTIVVGEHQPSVSRFARDHGYGTMPKLPDTMSHAEKLAANRAWIRARMDEGYWIVDLGPSPLKANYPYITSPYYAMESAEIAARGYSGWLPIWGV